jgi:hypothetical protein
MNFNFVCKEHCLESNACAIYNVHLLITVTMDLREIGWDGVDWVDLAQDRDQWRALVNTVMNLRVP